MANGLPAKSLGAVRQGGPKGGDQWTALKKFPVHVSTLGYLIDVGHHGNANLTLRDPPRPSEQQITERIKVSYAVDIVSWKSCGFVAQNAYVRS